MADTFSENPSFFENFATTAAQDLLSLQLTTGSPNVSQGVFTVSDPIVPDRKVIDRLSHMDPEIYDLRDSSHLMKLLQVLLGGAGAGGLRKQMAVARLQNAFNGMHFLDLDRFYGALFGIKRTQAEIQPNFAFNPYVDAATADTWDDVHARDASYRDRLVKFARSIPYGASYIGIKSMAEALCSCEVDVYESWEWIDEQDTGVMQLSNLFFTYSYLETNIRTWSAMEARAWGDWGGGAKLFVGRGGFRNRSDFVLHPKRPLAIDEQYELIRVLNTFKPAGTQLTVDNSGVSIHTTALIRDVAASSEYWEIISSVTPNPNLAYNPYANALKYLTDLPAKIPEARPAFSQYQGERWSYNGDITTVSSYTMGDSQLLSANDDELVVYSDGVTHSYQASDGLMTSAQANAARVVADGVMTSGAYAPTRSGINTATVVTA
jgi:hypothetical protein